MLKQREGKLKDGPGGSGMFLVWMEWVICKKRKLGGMKISYANSM